MELDKLKIVVSNLESGVAGKLYELIIVGGGPAGITAGVYAARKKMDTLLISRDIGGQMLLTLDIENYIGYQFVTGAELSLKFEEQIDQYPIAVNEMDEVTGINQKGEEFVINTGAGADYRTKVLIIATGRRWKTLNIPGEKEFVGKGVSYCTVCDAPLFKGKDVVILGGGNSGVTGAIDLSKHARRVYLLELSEKLNADPILLERAQALDNVEYFLQHKLEEIQGESQVQSVSVKDLSTHTLKVLDVQGVFIEVGSIPNSELVNHLVKLNQKDEILIDYACRTNVPGIFGAGDVTSVPEKQIIISAGEGAKAALGAYQYLLRK
ncbi:FAD-dependent oxidoreductase [Candidatus Poribacteria bacterium]